MDKFSALLKSRKFWAALVGLVFIFTGERAGLTVEQVVNGVYVVVAYILGTALEDSKASQ